MSSKAHVNSDKKMSQLPGWLWPNSNVLSPLYKRIWEAVQEDLTRPGAMHSEILVDTNKIFPLLLTSQLPTEILGYIWSLANQKYAGQLTEQELYIVLALVALAQASYPFNSLEVLYYIRIPPTPNLNLTLLDTITSKNEIKVHVSPFESPPVNSSVTSKKHGNSTRFSNKSVSMNNDGLSYSNHNHPDSKEVKFSSGHQSSYNSNAVYVDGRQNFYTQSESKHQSSYSTDSNDEFSEFQSAPVTNVPSIPNIWDSKQGSAIGSRLANHNLGVKKLNDKVKKTGTSKTNNSNQTRNTPTSTSVPHNRDASTEHLSELFPKCTVKNQAKTVILKDTAIRNNDSVEIVKPVTKNFISNTEKIVINKIHSVPKPIHSKTPDSIYVAPLKEPKEDALQQDLMSLQPTTEDKYSALRALVEEPPLTSIPKLNDDSISDSLAADDFGDFISAEPTITEPTSITESSNALNSVDLLSDFDFNTESIIGTNSKSSPSLIQEISEAFNALAFDENINRQIKDKFDAAFDTDKVTQREDTLSVNSIEQITQREDAVSVNSIELGPAASGVLTRSGSVPSLDLKSFLPTSQEDEQQIENMHQMIYWEWKQYMESCVLLLQVAANIFTSITSEIVLREVLSSAQGYNFLCNLAEVAAVCRRVNFSHKEMDINIMGFDDLLMDIDRIWSEMEPFYANIPIVTELPAWPLHQGDGVTCSLCLTIITGGRIVYNDNNYHATCANLWLHTVNNNLPVLRYPVPYMQSAITHSVNHT